MLLTPYGLREWLIITVVCALVALALVLFQWYWALIVPAVLWLALASFFRDPIRFVPKDLDPGVMLSPADGVISAVERVDHHDATECEAVVIRIFLSVLNVHINRAPCDCEVVATKFTPGQFLNAQTEESARVNESKLITLSRERADGLPERFGVRQVSGMIARTIVSPLKPGDRLKRGQKFGMIKFGSTTELILPRPEQVNVLVKKGDKVKGGLTRLATVRS
jgi:phosphatidylserine decarboxylase